MTGDEVVMDFDLVQLLAEFMIERHLIYLRRQEDVPWPWTDDPILQRYHFCNVFRELDKTTDWLRREWYEPNDGDENLLFAACLARSFNRIEMLEAVGYPHEFDGVALSESMTRRMAEERPVFSNAYRTFGNGKGVNRTDLLVRTFVELWRYRQRCDAVTVLDVYDWLCGFRGFGPFNSCQIVLDLAMTGRLRGAPDVDTFVVVGPGAIAVLGEMFGVTLDRRADQARGRKDQVKALKMLEEVRSELESLWPSEFPTLRPRDVEHSLCEFGKYRRYCDGRTRGMRKHRP